MKVALRRFFRSVAVTVPVLAVVAALGACSPEVGSKAWCEDMKQKDKGKWTAEEAGQFAKHCVL